jgi:hypothetical protein
MSTPIVQIAPARRFPIGTDLITAGKCPIQAKLPMACLFCLFGHLMECHYPDTCEQAKCSHYEAGLPPKTATRYGEANDDAQR